MEQALLPRKQENGMNVIDEGCQQIQQLDNIMKSALTVASMTSGMVKTIKMSTFIMSMQAMLTDEIMFNIMALQGKAGGFKTDKDREDGYPPEVVKSCVIDAARYGLTPVGNEFNILVGNMYITKEGCNSILRQIGVRHFETPGIPELHSEKQVTTKNGTRVMIDYSAKVKIEWYDKDGKKQEQDVTFLINFNNGMTMDAINGKAVRKARKWLIDRITGMDIADADADEAPVTIDITPKKSVLRPAEKEKTLPANANEALAEQAGQPAKDAGLEKIDRKLADLKVSDITAEDIRTCCANTGNAFNADFVASNVIQWVNWVRSFRAKDESNSTATAVSAQ